MGQTVTAPPVSAESPRAERGRRPRPPARKVMRTGFIVTAVAIVAVTFTYPFLWLVSASLKPRYQVFDNVLVPESPQPGNYTSLLDTVPFLTWFANSMIVGIMAALTVTLSSALVAFGFAYFRFPGRNTMFGIVLGTMMLPAAVTMIPTYLIWQELGLGQTQVPLWAHNVFASAFYVFLMRQFFLSLPRDTFEAGRVDGCGYFGLFWRIAMPLCRPALIVVFIFEFRASWTDLIRPLIYLQDQALYTLPRGLKAVLDAFGQGGEQKWEIVMAASVLATVPLIVLFFCAQRYFVEGIATQGRKG